jgi:hypothetical protein
MACIRSVLSVNSTTRKISIGKTNKIKRRRSRIPNFSSSPPSAVSGENPTAPPCPAQPSSLPRGVPAGCATPCPPAGSGRPRRAHARNVGCRGPAGPLCRWTRPIVLGLGLESWSSTVRRFSDFQFLFNILEKLYKLQNA